MKDPYYQRMLVTSRGAIPTGEYLRLIQTCARAGITSLQLREKEASYSECLDFGLQLKEVLAPYEVPLIVNDSIELTLAIGAEGVHLGQSDGCPHDARERLGPNKIIGVSIDTIPQLKIANAAPIDYVGIGAIFPTKHKHNVQTIWNLKGLRTLARHSRHPIVGIGGIDIENTSAVMQAGASGVAVIGAIHESPNPEAAVKALREATRSSFLTR